jgi:acetyl esterase/lipase
MTKVPPEKQLTREQLQKKFRRMRSIMSLMPGGMAGPRKPAGKELFLDTQEGKVRVLAYNLGKAGTLPLYVDVHGGGFTLGHAEMDDRYMVNVAEKAGIKILSIDYSLAPEAMFPKALNECYGVVKYAKEHAAELGIDPDNIALGGHSAGGNLSAAALLLDAERHELDVKCLILDYPPLDIDTDPYLKPQPKHAISPKMARLFNAAYCTKEEAKSPLVSPYFATAEQVRSFPPTLIITAGQDSLAPEAEAFRDTLFQAGVAVTHKGFEGCRHGFTLRGGPEADEAWQMMIDHLNTYVGAGRPQGG